MLVLLLLNSYKENSIILYKKFNKRYNSDEEIYIILIRKNYEQDLL